MWNSDIYLMVAATLLVAIVLVWVFILKAPVLF